MAAAAVSIQTSRAAALERLLCAAGPVRSAAGGVGFGPEKHGYEAHGCSEAQPGISLEPCTYDRGITIFPAPSVGGVRVRKSGRRGYPV